MNSINDSVAFPLQTKSALDAAKQYQARNWHPLPIPYRLKGCTITGWPDYEVKEEHMAAAFASPCNVGVLLEKSDLTDVDIDSPDAAPFLDWLPPTKATWGRSGNPHSHHLYNGARPSRTFANDSGPILEIRSHGCHATLPPSTHPIGEPYTWETEGEPGVADNLEDSVIRIAIAATIYPKWHDHSRHALALAISGALLKSSWSEERVLDLVTRVAKAAGDDEIGDRKKAVKDTAENLKKGTLVSGWTKLSELIGKSNADAIWSWVQTEADSIFYLINTAKGSSDKKHVAAKLCEDLNHRGKFYQTPEQEFLFFHTPESVLYDVNSRKFKALCAELYGLNGKEPVWSYIEEHLYTYCIRHGQPIEYYQFARYQNHRLYINAGENRVLRLNGTCIESIDNGTDGVLFKHDPSLSPINAEYQFSGSPVRDRLVNVANAVDPVRLDLYEIFIYTVFFESELPTKPIVLLTGVKGSGKTSAGRSLKRALFGPSANVDTGMTSRDDAFWAAVCHSSLVCMDNVDTLVTWLADALAVVATGGKYHRRQLYETNKSVEYTPRCFTMITSRNPQSFTRDDVVDRLLLIEVERRKDFIEESALLKQLDSLRGQIWGELLLNLNMMVAELKKPITNQPLPYRLADWARLALRFGPILGIKDVKSKLDSMEVSKIDFALDDNPVSEGLQAWVSQNPQHGFITTGDLFHAIVKIYEAKGGKYTITTARSFGMQLKNLRSALEAHFKIEDKAGPSNTKLFRFTPLSPTSATSEQTQTESLASQL